MISNLIAVQSKQHSFTKPPSHPILSANGESVVGM